ncbi:hypothetical protein NDU88_013089, partial [Pleurodeles waltl]
KAELEAKVEASLLVTRHGADSSIHHVVPSRSLQEPGFGPPRPLLLQSHDLLLSLQWCQRSGRPGRAFLLWQR